MLILCQSEHSKLLSLVCQGASPPGEDTLRGEGVTWLPHVLRLDPSPARPHLGGLSSASDEVLLSNVSLSALGQG